jgi:hypothetical protein
MRSFDDRSSLTPDERFSEIAAILAGGVLRLQRPSCRDALLFGLATSADEVESRRVTRWHSTRIQSRLLFAQLAHVPHRLGDFSRARLRIAQRRSSALPDAQGGLKRSGLRAGRALDTVEKMCLANLAMRLLCLAIACAAKNNFLNSNVAND